MPPCHGTGCFFAPPRKSVHICIGHPEKNSNPRSGTGCFYPRSAPMVMALLMLVKPKMPTSLKASRMLRNWKCLTVEIFYFCFSANTGESRTSTFVFQPAKGQPESVTVWNFCCCTPIMWMDRYANCTIYSWWCHWNLNSTFIYPGWHRFLNEYFRMISCNSRYIQNTNWI